MRSFIALKLPDHISKIVYEFTELLCHRSNLKFKMIPSANYHVTLKFLGDIEIDKMKEIEIMLDSISKIVDPVELSLDQLLFFPSKSGGSVVIKIDGNFNAAYIINKKMEELGYKDNRRFAPHLTICKLKGKEMPLLEKKRLGNIKFSVDSFSLFKSKLTPNGAIYTELKNFKWRKM